MKKSTYIQARNRLKTGSHILPLTLAYPVIDVLIAYTISVSWLMDSYFRFFTAPLLTILLFRQFSIMHEASHNVLSKFRSVNDLWGLIAGTVAFLPYRPWKAVHLQHHFWTGNSEKDPVMALVHVIPRLSKLKSDFLSWLWKSWIPILAILQHIVFWITSFKSLKKKNWKAVEVVSVLAPPIFWISLAAIVPTEVILFLILPGWLLYLGLVEVVNLPHHLDLPRIGNDLRLQIWDQHLSTRSCIYPKWFASLVVLNFNYHVEHHLFPDLPWYQLPKAHQILKEELGLEYKFDQGIDWIVKSRKKNLQELIQSNNEPIRQTG